jgi:hypothetical protein
MLRVMSKKTKTTIDLASVPSAELARELARRRKKNGYPDRETLSRAGQASGRARRLKARLAAEKRAKELASKVP